MATAAATERPHLDAYAPELRRVSWPVVSPPQLEDQTVSGPRQPITILAATAEQVMSTFTNLEELARTSGIDFEATIWELIEEEREQLQRMRNLDAYRDLTARQEAKFAKLFHAGKLTRERLEDAQAVASDYASIAATHRNVYEAYKRCRRNLEQLRDQRLRDYAAEWTEYLRTLESVIPADLAQAVRDLWGRAQSEHLWAPTARVRDDRFLMLWDRGRHHLEIEVFSSGFYDWFYRDRSDDSFTSGEDIPMKKTPPPLKVAIRKTRKG